jgi:hypothetical protein
VPIGVSGFGARKELVQEVGEASRVLDVEEVPGAVEQLETAGGQRLVGRRRCGRRGSRISGPGDEQDRCLGQQVQPLVPVRR